MAPDAAHAPPADDLVEETVALADGSIAAVRPRDSEALLDEAAFEHEEFLPYWAELWPSGVALARTVSARALRGARTLELGCGLGLPSVAAALAGARVLATDWSPDALRFTRMNAERNAAQLETALCDWRSADAIVGRGPWELVLASDVLYERRGAELLLELLPRLVGDRGEVWLADPGRPPSVDFLAHASDEWDVRSRSVARWPRVALHRMYRRRTAAS